MSEWGGEREGREGKGEVPDLRDIVVVRGDLVERGRER